MSFESESPGSFLTQRDQRQIVTALESCVELELFATSKTHQAAEDLPLKEPWHEQILRPCHRYHGEAAPVVHGSKTFIGTDGPRIRCPPDRAAHSIYLSAQHLRAMHQVCHVRRQEVAGQRAPTSSEAKKDLGSIAWVQLLCLIARLQDVLKHVPSRGVKVLCSAAEGFFWGGGGPRW